MLKIDSKLYSYDIAANSLSPPFFHVTTGMYGAGYIFAQHDGASGFFFEGNTLYLFPLDASAAPEVLAVETKSIKYINLAGSYVIFDLGVSHAVDQIKAIPKAGGAPIVLVTKPAESDLYMAGLGEAYLYYNIRSMVSKKDGLFTYVPLKAGVVAVDNSGKVEYAEAAWVGQTNKVTFDYSTGNGHSLFPDKMILAQDFNLPNASGGYSGATLKSHDAASGAFERDLGHLPATDEVHNIQCGGYTSHALCNVGMALKTIPALSKLPFQSDIFYLNTTVSDSLERVTNSTGENEYLIGY